MWHLLIDKVEFSLPPLPWPGWSWLLGERSGMIVIPWLSPQVGFSFIAPQGFLSHPKTRARVALLGPCFKMGQMKPPTANSLKRSREPCARRRDGPASHYRSSPRWRPLLERGSSGYEGLHRWVKETLS